MSEAEKSVRLSKVARELNIGLHTIVDYLAGKGHKVDSNPNAKISEDGYALLLKEFQSEKTVKEQSQQLNIGKHKKDSVILAADSLPKVSSRAEEEAQDEVLIKNNGTAPVEKPAAPAPIPTPVPVPAPVEPVVAVTPEPPAPVKEKGPEVIKAQADSDFSLKVIGKIDLSELNRGKGKPKKKEPEPEVAPAAPAPIAEPVAATPAPVTEEEKPVHKEEPVTPVAVSQPEAPVVTAVVNPAPEAPAQTPPVALNTEPAAPAVPAPDAGPEIYRRDITKLSGPTILGKIELPVERKPSPGGGSAADRDRKKKRKRTEGKKLGTEYVIPPTTSGPGGNANKPQDRKKFDKKPAAAPKVEPTDKEIQDQIKATLARLSGGGKSKGSKLRRMKRGLASQQAEEERIEQELKDKVLQVTEFVTANELAKMMDVSVTQIISTCMSLGIFVSINQRLDAETLTVVAGEFGYTVDFVTADVQEAIEEEAADKPEDLKPRPPIVTVMGHVDHGKTSLLDYVRKANVIAGEAGGITQHIGAYEVTLESGRELTFLDTPGHEAFTAMRARGAKLTDVAIIVVAADDSVMPQTREAINHAQAAGVPIVFAINKIDKPGANPDKIREALSAMNILVEEWGGKYQCQEISAKKGTGIDTLLDKVLLEAEILDLKANPDKRAVGTVVESSLDKGRGYVTTVLVQTGTLKIGDVMLAGYHSGRVKAMFNERGGRVDIAGPSTPVVILGLTGAPQAGDTFNVLNDEREAREIANKRQQLQREQGIRTQKHITLDEIGRRLAIGNFKELNVIVKGDVDGSIEALTDSLLKLSTPEIQVNVIHKGVGQISESDVTLASASNAIIIGFQVRPSVNARKLAEQEQIDIRLYSIIYDAINEIKAAMEGMLAPEFEEKIVCNVEVRETFKIPKVGTIAGCMVQSGKIHRNTSIRIIRDGIVVHTGELASLKRFKDDMREVATGYECGLNIANFNNIEVGDLIEGYEQVAIKRTLA